MLENFFSLFQTGFAAKVFHAAWIMAPVWLPLIFILTWFDLWMTSRQREYINAQGGMLLEIRIPREMDKSPLAMEVFLGTLYQTGVGTLLDVYFKGRVRPWFSLELVSIDGGVHFFMWLHPKFKNIVESQLYAQFPNIEVHEVADYSLGVEYNPEKLSFGWMGQFALTKADAYPIKTYIDYGLDKDPKEEFRIDPIVPLLEFLGSMRRGEQVWIQILVQGHTKENLKYGRISTKPDWKSGIDKEIKELIGKARFKPEGDTPPSSLHLSKDQQETIAAIERVSAKPAFDTMIRAAYIAEKDVFDANNIGGLLGSFRQFGSNTLNGFKPDWKAAYDYPWEDPTGKNRASNEKKILEAYKRRSFFNRPFKNFHGKPFILTSEELATLWHFPSAGVAATPTLNRIPSKKAEAPSNLPI
jgi:hypothetical protein